jgi:hypothetical protein
MDFPHTRRFQTVSSAWPAGSDRSAPGHGMVNDL